MGLDTPASAGTIAETLRQAGYAVGHLPEPDALMHALTKEAPTFAVSLAAYRDWLTTLSPDERGTLDRRWGEPEADPVCTRRGVPIPDGRGHYCFPPTTSS